MARVRSANTALESALRRALWHVGLRYRLHPKLPGTPDFVFARHRIAVFVDGCFWHGCPIHYKAPSSNADFWARKLARNQDRDRRVNVELQHLGWLPVRVWEHEVNKGIEKVVEQIFTLLAKANKIGNP